MDVQAAQLSMAPGAAALSTERCAMCGRSVVPDVLGFLECPCGWGGPGDPLEMGSGVGRGMQRLGRKLADRQARRDLRWLRTPGKHAASIGFGYAVVLFLASTCVFLLLYATLAASVYFGYRFALERAWVGLGLCALCTAAVVFMLFRRSPRHRAILAPRQQFPRLATTLDEVSQRVGAPVPDRVILTPHAEAFVYAHRPLRRLLRRELVLGLGVGALPLLSEMELKAILTHELAHYRHGDTALHRYFGQAEAALARLIFILSSGSRPSRRFVRRRGDMSVFADMAMDLLTLPVRLIWMLFHFLRLHESRMAEFAADRIAAEHYGELALMNGLTGLTMASETLRGAGTSLVGQMRKHGGRNLYAELRTHYASLPPALISQLRLKAAQDFRSLQRTHPSTPDRLRAVYGLGILPPSEPARPAFELLVPAGATSPEAVETALTTLWLK